jgi:hypothetical protein
LIAVGFVALIAIMATILWHNYEIDKVERSLQLATEAANADLEGNPELSLYMAREAATVARPPHPQAFNALHRPLYSSRLRLARVDDAELFAVAFAPDGKRLASADANWKRAH